ncbi:hypothetical protein KKG52_04070 [Patescibacteria group bacterium]|nr:hypothetical protein [Patescibacteria group bacterium]
MRNSINQKYFESFANELAGKFRRINHLTTNARVAIGSYHEEILKVAIKNFLSDRYTVKTGYIYYDDQNISNQVDILIIDENYSFSYLFKEGDFAIVKPEAVVCAIEVKSVLDKKNFEQSILNITRAKEIKQKSLTGGLTGLIFGYESPKTTNKWLENCFMSGKLSSLTSIDHFWPNTILFFNQSELLLFDSQGRQDKDKNKYYSRLYKNTNLSEDENIKANQSYKLAVFISFIMAALGGNEISASNRFVENNFSQLVDHEGQKLGIDGFRIGAKRVLRKEN